ncbi:unnamed protein product [Ectocarpus sp. 4 AP-2014]
MDVNRNVFDGQHTRRQPSLFLEMGAGHNQRLTKKGNGEIMNEEEQGFWCSSVGCARDGTRYWCCAPSPKTKRAQRSPYVSGQVTQASVPCSSPPSLLVHSQTSTCHHLFCAP